jgi:uncharacterized protein (TIGR02145 family)
MRQSLYYAPKNNVVQMTETDGRAWGYYADGYFDRRPIVKSVGGLDAAVNSASAVAVNTKDVAYVGILFFNANNGNRSLFVPAVGSRYSGGNGTLNNSGSYGHYWSSSAYSQGSGWNLTFNSSCAYQNDYFSRAYGFSIRCVEDE